MYAHIAQPTLLLANPRPAWVEFLRTEDPAGVLAILLGCLALIFWFGETKAGKAVFGIIPKLVFCYFLPTTLTTIGILPDDNPLYSWTKGVVLPASLLLLILALDIPGIIRLGWKPVAMLLAGTTGVVFGGPLALYVGQSLLHGTAWELPADTWQGLAALSGSWIGGGANFIALGDIFGTSSDMLAAMVVPDVLVANVWMGVLLFCAARQFTIDRWTGADASSIRALEQRLADFQEKIARTPTLGDLMIIFALGFGISYLGNWAADAIGNDAHNTVQAVAIDAGITEVHKTREQPPLPIDDDAIKGVHIGRALQHRLDEDPDLLDDLSGGRRTHLAWARFVNEVTGASLWKYVLVTTLGLILSFTRARNLEGAGASKVGSVMLYLLVAVIGATADFGKVAEAPGYIVVGFMWMAMHIVVLLVVAWLIKAPIFFVAVGSQANIGGAASAPIVAAAYHPALAPVGVLLAVAGYVLGTYAGWFCGKMLQWVGT
jgi:uncharacterized membrane protein